MSSAEIRLRASKFIRGIIDQVSAKRDKPIIDIFYMRAAVAKAGMTPLVTMLDYNLIAKLAPALNLSRRAATDRIEFAAAEVASLDEKIRLAILMAGGFDGDMRKLDPMPSPEERLQMVVDTLRQWPAAWPPDVTIDKQPNLKALMEKLQAEDPFDPEQPGAEEA